MTEQLEPVAFDIETTGLGATDEVTVAGLALSLGVRVFVQTEDRAADALEGGLEADIDGVAHVSTHDSEAALLAALEDFVGERLQDRDVVLVAYNGEIWRGGFDLPFLRTRLAVHDRAWPFHDLPYVDVMPVITDRFNTTVDGDEVRDLVGAYEALCDGSISAMDPFADSAAAAQAFHDGAVADLLAHNVADVLRTRALALLAQRYCSPADLNMKSLSTVSNG